MSDGGTGQWNKVPRIFGELVYIPPSIVYFGTWAALQYNPLTLKIASASKMALFFSFIWLFPESRAGTELSVVGPGNHWIWWPHPCLGQPLSKAGTQRVRGHLSLQHQLCLPRRQLL